MAKPRRTVLVVDGSEKNYDGYRQHLQQDAVFSYQVIFQQTPLKPLLQMPDQPIDGILLDLEALRPGEFHFFDHLRASLEESCPPLVVVGNGDPDYIVQAFKHGAVDYLVRDTMTDDTLCRCLRTAIENAELKRQLQRNRNRFHTSVESLMDCFGIFSAMRDETGQIIDFRIDYMNQAACENNRMPRESQIGRGLCEVLPGHRESGLFDTYCHLVETGEPLVKESVFFEDTYGGHQEIVRAFDIRATQLDDGFVASWRDITERKRMELGLSQTVTDLQQEQGRLQRLIDTAPIGIGISTSSGKVEVINDTMLALHGYSREEFEDRGMNWQDFIPPESREAAEQSLTQLRQQGKLLPHERELQRLDGTRVPVWFSATQWVYSSDEHVAFAVDLTAQKETEAALRKSRQRYRELAEAMPQIVWTANAAGEIDYWNQRWYEYTGFSEIESLGLEGVEAVHPEERDRTLSQWQQALTTGEPFEMEYRIRRHDGVYCWFICRALPTQDEQGQIKGWIGTITDIEQLKQTKEQLRRSDHQLRQELTERSRAEEALRRATERLDLVLKSAPIILCTQDRDLRYTWVYNPDLNLSEEEIIGRRDEDLLSPDSAQRLTSLKQQVLHTGLGLRQEIEVLHSDQTAHYDITIDPLWDEHNAINGIACAAIDMTDRVRLAAERLQAEAALLENERLLRLALSGANAGSWSWEVATCKMNWSPENCVLYGFNPAQGSPSFDAWFNTIHPEDQDRVNRDIANVIEQRFPTYRSEFRILHPRRGIRWMLGQGRLTLDDQGNPTRLSGINLDITDQKTAIARQEELLQREQAARAEAERANRVKDEFLAILSHELRSPLNPILGWSKLLQQKQFSPEKTQQALTTIERNAKLQTQLIDDLLDIARILRGKLKLKTAPVDLSFVIQSAMETVKPAAVAKSIDIQFTPASTDPKLQETPLQVTGDDARLQQIIWNLLSNAIKFTPSGGRVEVRLERVVGGVGEVGGVGGVDETIASPTSLTSTYARITVTDTGKGISPDFLPHLFESFRQEDISITRQYGGLGLGLAIVRYLVEAHGGTITADSPGEGLGAAFTITLPLLRNNVSDQEAARTQPKGCDLQGIRVLAVDDDPDTRELLRAFLTFYGADVRIVSSAAEALAQWQILQPDILLSDLGMPDITGYDLIQQIRALPSSQGQQVPAIALSAYAREGDQQRSLAWGFQQHIAKPLELDNLVQSIAKLVQRIP